MGDSDTTPVLARRPLRLLLAISALDAGGAERVITVLANALADRGYEVSLLTLAPVESDFFRVSERVTRITLGLRGPSHSCVAGLLANASRALALRRIVRRMRAEVVVSFMTDMNVVSIVACLGLPVAVLVSERVDPRAHRVAAVWSWLRRLTYPHADGLVVQTDSIAAWYEAWRARRPKVAVIPNPVAAHITAPRPPAAGLRYLFAVGRLTPQKGFDLLIRALALLVREGSDLELVIAGEGPEKAALAGLAAELSVSSRVRLLGRINDPASWMAAAFCFVLSSRYEGFPNVLVEALACGAPVIATDCPSGPREILENGKYGLLVPCEDPASLAAAVRTLERGADLRSRLREQGPRAVDRFRVPSVVARWESLLQHAVEGR